MLLAALALTVVAEPVAAQPEMSIPFITTPQFVFFRAAHSPALTIIEANTNHLAATDTGAFALSFLPAGNPLSSGFSIAPTIGQTSARTIACDRSYFFQDFVST
jgi:hypothetical protein